MDPRQPPIQKRVLQITHPKNVRNPQPPAGNESASQPLPAPGSLKRPRPPIDIPEPIPNSETCQHCSINTTNLRRHLFEECRMNREKCSSCSKYFLKGEIVRKFPFWCGSWLKNVEITSRGLFPTSIPKYYCSRTIVTRTCCSSPTNPSLSQVTGTTDVAMR